MAAPERITLSAPLSTSRRWSITLVTTSLLLQLREGSAGLYSAAPNIIQLDPETFNSSLTDGHAWVVNFFAEWCPHCLHYAPMWIRMAAALSTEPQVRFGVLDCGTYTVFCGQLGLTGFPTVRAFNISTYPGSLSPLGANIEPRMTTYLSERDFPRWIRAKLFISSPINDAPPKPLSVATPPPAAPSASQVALRGSIPAGSVAALRLVDAEVALLVALRQGVFLPAGASQVLSGAPYEELLSWLDFLSVTMPGDAAHRDLTALARRTRAAASTSPDGPALARADWEKLLDEQGVDRAPPAAGKEPAAYWRLCTTFTCGLWTLFHLLTVSISLHHTGSWLGPGGLLSFASPSKVPSPEEGLERIRCFVASFFGCTVCRDHFLQLYDGCGLDRCLLSPGDGPAAALWLWRMHNDVTVRVAEEQKIPNVSPWPPAAECTKCWTGKPAMELEAWDSSHVYSHLRSQYWMVEWGPKGTDWGAAQRSIGAGPSILAGGAVVIIMTYLAVRCCNSETQNLGRVKGS